MSNNEKSTAIVPQEIIESKILIIRNKKVLIDRDLAELYGVTTGNLNKAVKRNIERFPEDFMFQLTKEEFENLKFQFGISRWGGTRKLPFVFTENGVAMLSSVLNSTKAIQVNIQIMRTFTKLRLLLSNEDLRDKIKVMQKDHDNKFFVVFESIQELSEEMEDIKKLLAPLPQIREKAGFIKEK